VQYVAFEQATPLADGWLVLTALAVAMHLWRRRTNALMWLCMFGGAGLYLCALDVLYDLEHGVYTMGRDGASVLDNSSTHSTLEVKRWLERHKRVHFHFTPTGASSMNMIETWFSILTNQQVRRGVYHDVPELVTAIEYFIENYNERAQPSSGPSPPSEPSPKQPNHKTLQEHCTSDTHNTPRNEP
jgi:hypothetical protein